MDFSHDESNTDPFINFDELLKDADKSKPHIVSFDIHHLMDLLWNHLNLWLTDRLKFNFKYYQVNVADEGQPPEYAVVMCLLVFIQLMVLDPDIFEQSTFEPKLYVSWFCLVMLFSQFIILTMTTTL